MTIIIAVHTGNYYYSRITCYYVKKNNTALICKEDRIVSKSISIEFYENFGFMGL